MDWNVEILRDEYPGLADRVEEVLKTADHYIYFKMDDGKVLRYDDILKTVRYFRDEYDLQRTRIIDEMEFRRIFQNKIVRLLTYEGMRQDELADRVDMSVGAISKYINMRATPSAYVLYKIAAVFDRDVNYFYDIY